MSYETVKWQGGSGKHYSYTIFPIENDLNPNQYGNYIFVKQTQRGWDAVLN